MPDYKTIDQLPVELNIRDLGGLAAKDGRHVKSGLIFRSSALAFLTKKNWSRCGIWESEPSWTFGR